MGSFVLVPGAFLGGWAWQRIARPLRMAGHDVYPITLTGLGDRAHLEPSGFDGHVMDVVASLAAEDLHDVLLVGHSYGGTVVSAVAERIPERLAHLVYLDAIVVEDGQSNADALRQLGGGPALDAFTDEAAQRGDGRFTSDTSAWGLAADDLEWVRTRAVAHPLNCLYESVQLGNPAAAKLARTYILHTEALRPLAEGIRSAGGTVHELFTVATGPVGHYSMFTAPAEVATLLSHLGPPPRLT